MKLWRLGIEAQGGLKRLDCAIKNRETSHCCYGEATSIRISFRLNMGNVHGGS